MHRPNTGLEGNTTLKEKDMLSNPNNLRDGPNSSSQGFSSQVVSPRFGPSLQPCLKQGSQPAKAVNDIPIEEHTQFDSLENPVMNQSGDEDDTSEDKALKPWQLGRDLELYAENEEERLLQHWKLENIKGRK